MYLPPTQPCRIAVPISVGVYGAIAVSACRVTRSIRVKAAALGAQRKSRYRQHQGCKNEARHRTPPLLLMRAMTLDDDSVILTLPPSPPSLWVSQRERAGLLKRQ